MKREGRICALCISEKRGTQKKSVGSSVLIRDWGLEGDAHAGKWHRQVSLLSREKIEEFNRELKRVGAKVSDGDFGENLILDGIDPGLLPVGTLLRIRGEGGPLLRITQIGKDCHSHCAIFEKVGKCIMPTEGAFSEVVEGGEIAQGDPVFVEKAFDPFPFQAAVITLSDSGAAGLREDLSGPLVSKRLSENGYQVRETLLLPDGREALEKALIRLADHRQLDLILTSGGTGLGPRDLTPEATFAVADRIVPGIAEAMRAGSMAITKHAMLSRAASVIRGKTLIINLPGSPRACMECMDIFMDALPHAIYLLRGEVRDCAREEEVDRKEIRTCVTDYTRE